MAKSEGPSIPNFMHQMLRVGHTEHTSTFIPRLGMAKSEGPSISNFMHQMLRVGHTEHTSTFIPKIGRTCE